MAGRRRRRARDIRADHRIAVGLNFRKASEVEIGGSIMLRFLLSFLIDRTNELVSAKRPDWT
jgi:hypothetical protein